MLALRSTSALITLTTLFSVGHLYQRDLLLKHDASSVAPITPLPKSMTSGSDIAYIDACTFLMQVHEES